MELTNELNLSYEKPTLDIFENGNNVFGIVKKTKNLMENAGATQQEIENFLNEVISGDYNNLLVACSKYVKFI